MKKLIYLLLPATVLFASACKKDSVDPIVVISAATINGANEETPTGSAATGTATGTFNTNTKELNLTITYSGLVAIAGHIHKGAVGASGGVIFPFSSLTSPIAFTATLDATQEADLLAGLYYVNLHSVAFGGGEIRGQLVKQ